MISVSSRQIGLWAEDLPLSAGCKGPPVDLHAVARFRRVKRLEVRLMVRLGALVPVQQGYEIFLQGAEPRELDLAAPEIPEELTARQRFTLAHEIAHTYFYKGIGAVPVPTANAKTEKEAFELEKICDQAAKRILVPMRLLRNEARVKLGQSGQVNISLVRRMVSRFKVSYEVMLDRLNTMDPDDTTARCILLVREDEVDRPKVKGLYTGMGLLSVLPPIRRGQPISKWFDELPKGILERDALREYSLLRNGREFHLHRVPLRKSGDFLLQVDYLGRAASGPI